ncbi:hypothetical protein [Oenococcus oeni]|nr:hypothetical protein [Oenococcus oeni]
MANFMDKAEYEKELCAEFEDLVQRIKHRKQSDEKNLLRQIRTLMISFSKLEKFDSSVTYIAGLAYDIRDILGIDLQTYAKDTARALYQNRPQETVEDFYYAAAAYPYFLSKCQDNEKDDDKKISRLSNLFLNYLLSQSESSKS